MYILQKIRKHQGYTKLDFANIEAYQCGVHVGDGLRIYEDAEGKQECKYGEAQHSRGSEELTSTKEA